MHILIFISLKSQFARDSYIWINNVLLFYQLNIYIQLNPVLCLLKEP